MRCVEVIPACCWAQHLFFLVLIEANQLHDEYAGENAQAQSVALRPPFGWLNDKHSVVGHAEGR